VAAVGVEEIVDGNRILAGGVPHGGVEPAAIFASAEWTTDARTKQVSS